jgi:hypothetical protein
MVIQFGDKLQWVKRLRNPRYPVNFVEFLAIIYIFATFGGKCGLSNMHLVYVREITSM